jgi:hypothetical protein
VGIAYIYIHIYIWAISQLTGADVLAAPLLEQGCEGGGEV